MRPRRCRHPQAIRHDAIAEVHADRDVTTDELTPDIYVESKSGIYLAVRLTGEDTWTRYCPVTDTGQFLVTSDPVEAIDRFVQYAATETTATT